MKALSSTDVVSINLPRRICGSAPLAARPARATSMALRQSAASPECAGDPVHITPVRSGAERDAEAPAVRLFDEIVHQAALRRASDIHIEPLERAWRVRLRIDGQLHEIARPSAHLREPLTCRIKLLAHLDIGERRLPQDGRLKLARDGGSDEFRVSLLPTVHGEKVVLRRLDRLPPSLDLSALGLTPEAALAVEQALSEPTGMILITGPTGSGKTLSLFCLLQRLNRESLNVCTVEDPPELRLPGLNQVGVFDKAGMGFAHVLRALLRQDPDVLMIGEIRDGETADVALKAAQTGHKVLSTLHANDAPSALLRLGDLGVAPFRLAAGVRLVTAQRLVRRLCERCKLPTARDDASLLAAGLAPQALAEDWPMYRPCGCIDCHGIGYRGRVGVHQVMPVTPLLQRLIGSRADEQRIAEAARESGVRSLREAALDKVRAGLTTLDEALAATEAA